MVSIIMTFILCTSSEGKLAALIEFLQCSRPALISRIKTLRDFNNVPEPDEIQATTDEIARHKALEYFTLLGGMNATICDDTGLYIERLLGPGPYIKSMITDHGLDKICEVAGGSEAIFSVSVAVCYGTDDIRVHTESLKGTIAHEQTTSSTAKGFSFDRIFIPDGYDVTYSELSKEVIASISPRNKAFDNIFD